MSPKTKPPADDNDQPARTYFEWGRRFPELSGAKPGDPYPRLPAGTPWSGPGPGDEPTIDRSEDADTINMEDEQ
jgi:hypothetical protein